MQSVKRASSLLEETETSTPSVPEPEPGYGFPSGNVPLEMLRSFRQAEDTHGLPRNMLPRVAKIESNFNPNAVGPKTRTGEQAMGLMQIMKSMHPGVDPTDANASIEYAAKYLRQLKDKHGSWEKAISYYGGHGGDTESPEARWYIGRIAGPNPASDLIDEGGEIKSASSLLDEQTVNPQAEYYKQNLQNYLGEQAKQPMKAAEGFDTSTTGPITGVPLQYTPKPGETLVPEPVRELIGGAGEVAEGLPGAIAGGIAGGIVGGPIGAFAGAGLAVGYKEAYDAWKVGDVPRLLDIVTGGVVTNTPEKIAEAARNLGVAPDEIQKTKGIPARMRDVVSNLAQAVPFFGPMTQRVQELVKEGKLYRAAGYGLTMIAVPAVAETIGGERIGKASAKTAEEVKPIVEEAKQKQAIIDSLPDEQAKQVASQRLVEETKAKVDEVVTSNATDVVIKSDLENKAKEVKQAKVKKVRTPEQIEADKVRMAGLRAKRKTTKQVEPTTPGTLATPTPEKPLAGPSWALDRIEADYKLANSLGVISDIERLAYEGKTAKETVKELGNRLDRVAELAKANNEENYAYQNKGTLVRSVRNKLGIPSLDQATEYADWKRQYEARQKAGPEIVMTAKEQAKAKSLMEEGKDNGQIAFVLDAPEAEIGKLRQKLGIAESSRTQTIDPKAALSAQKVSIISRAEGLGLDAYRLSRKMFQKEFNDLSVEELERLDKGFSREPVRLKNEQTKVEPPKAEPISITKSDMDALDAKFGEDTWIEWEDAKVAEEIANIRAGKPSEVPKPVEITEPLTDIDLQTGSPEPRTLADADHPLSTDAEGTLEQQSAYSKSKSIAGSVQELIDQLKPGRTGPAKDPGVTLWKWMNDVNRYRNGDKAIDIAKARNDLSELAVKADEFKTLFDSEGEFEGWKELVSDAAEWARRADRSDLGTKLMSGIDPFEAARVLRDILRPLFGKFPSVERSSITNTRERILTDRLEEVKAAIEDPNIESRDQALKRAYTDIPDDISIMMEGSNLRSQEILRTLDQIRRTIKADRLKNEQTGGTQLYSGIPIDAIVEKLKDVWKSVSRTVVEGETSGKNVKDLLKENAEWKWNVVDLNTLFDDNKRYTDKEVVSTLESIAGKPNTELLKFYSGVPIDELIRLAKSASAYVDRSRGMKTIKPKEIPRSLVKFAQEEIVAPYIEKSGNVRRELHDQLGEMGHEAIQRMVVSKGATARATVMLRQMRKEVYNGLRSNEKKILDKLILTTRIVDIGSYKKPKQFIFPKDEAGNELNPNTSSAYTLMFQQLEGLSPEKAYELYHLNPDGTAGGRVGTYYNWMRKALQDMFDEGLIDQEQFDSLVKHNYRRIGTIDSPLTLADLIDKKYETKIGDVKRTIYDSGVERLARGKSSDIYEPSSEIMALEVFNRAYGRIMNNQANKVLLEIARSQPDNPFVRTKINKGDKIPSGWTPFFVYEKGIRKTIHLSPEVAHEWITNTRDVSPRLASKIRYASFAPLTRTFATGIEWMFALANLPRDMQHIWFAARTFENGKWKPVYSPHLPVYLPQIGTDIVRTFSDALLRKGTYIDMANEGGLMDFLVHQARPFQRGLHLEGPVEHMYNFLGYLGETSELMTRLAVRERVIRNKANELGIKVDEARKNPNITREATFAARDYLDFAQGGWATKAADQGIPYLNAAIQGGRTFFRSFKPGSGSAAASTYKLAQIATAATGLYLATKYLAPKTHEELRNDINTQNNFIIPFGDKISFKDAQGNTRYLYGKIPVDQNLRFFKKFFEASTDKWLGDPVDAAGTANALTQLSPVGISSLPPSINAALGYAMNKDFWRNEDIWKKTDKPFSWPASKNETIPGQTPQMATDVGQITGASPERLRYVMRSLIANSMWADLVGMGYEKVFGDLPPKQRQQHLAEVLARTPGIKRFIGVTNPYSRYSQQMDRLAEESAVNNYIENSRLDLRINGYLYDKNYSRKDVIDYIHSFKDEDTRDRMRADLAFQESMAKSKIENKAFWADLKRLPADAKAKAYVEELAQSTPERQAQLKRERGIVDSIGTILGEKFWEELPKAKKALKNR